MATYTELFDLRSNSDFRNKVAVAVVVKAQTLLDGTPTAGQIVWANASLADPGTAANSLLNYVLAANKALSSATILAAADTAIQTNVDAAVDAILTGA